jgi:polyisoprenoid-binding protein YceI
MTASAQQDTTLFPVGTYVGDTVHSTANFTVKYVVSSFTGGFEKVEPSLEVAEDGQVKLVGKVDANSVVVKDENLTAHLKGPDFFDTEKYPELTFESTEVTRDGDQVKVVGDLTIKGNTQRVEGTGTVVGPVEDFMGNTKVGLTLETVVDRTAFGVDWNAALPAGGFALANDVKLVVDLQFVKA